MGECSVVACDGAIYARGWCKRHYRRWQRHGDPLAGRTFEGEPRNFLETIAIPFQGDECLFWPYRTNSAGYAQLDGGKNVGRLICEAVHGPAPSPKHEAAHSCGNGHLGCVNAGHLDWKTPAENNFDRVIHGTSNRGERCASAKLTRDQVLEIRKLGGTLLQREIGEMFGISPTNVRGILRRRVWGWLNDDGTESLSFNPRKSSPKAKAPADTLEI